MKTKIITALAAFVLVFSACNKDEDDTGDGTPPEEDYQPVTAGSTWQYSSTYSGPYTETATGGDTTIGGEKYFIFDNSEDGRRYINKNGTVYKTYGYIQELDKNLDMIYLKDAAAGTFWEEDETFTQVAISVPVKFKYTIASRDGDKVVNNITYKNVIAVDLTVTATSPLVGGTITVATGRQFYAKGVGSISSSLNFSALGTTINDSTYLVSSDIKK